MQLLHFSIYVSFLIISTILYPIPRCFCAVDEVYTDCSSSFDCANLKNLSYPFWGSNRPVYCGHPDFKLVCDGENAEITITSQSYQVLEVRYSDYSFQVVRTDFWKNACPTQLENNSINYSLFDYGSDLQNLTLFYGCPFSSPYTSFTQFNCTINGTQMFDYFTVENILEDAETPEIQTWATCKSRVIIPILESQVSVLNESSTLENLEAAINKGFSLKSKANNDWCSKCQKSAGYCGYNPSSSEFSCYCRDGSSLSTCGSMKKRSQRLKTAIGISAGIGGIAIIFILIICSLKMHSRIKGKKITKETRVFHHHNLETFMEDHGSLAPKRYSYSKVKKMTKSFSNKLGQGGYGVVYKASLPDGRLVAIKVISESNGSGEEFLNEVASISRTSHVNIVTLLGFCYERNKKALIYEYMPNGSLDKFIYKKGSFNAICSLEWMTMYQISIGVARGLEYLHRGCNTRILHFDIKPQNILLDEDFCPKISDFGLAKICLKKESVVSILGARGTVGFIAPEVFSKTFGRVSHKSDVYSFGMLVLEMVGGRKNYDSGGSHSDEMYFPDWIYKDLEQGKILSNSLSITEEENEVVRKMTLVSLWCIQTNPLDRPSMSKVVEMLEGPLHSISFPPKPSLHSATATTSPLQFSDGSTIEILETDSISS